MVKRFLKGLACAGVGMGVAAGVGSLDAVKAYDPGLKVGLVWGAGLVAGGITASILFHAPAAS